MKNRLLPLLFLFAITLCIECGDSYGQKNNDNDTAEISQSLLAGDEYMDARISAMDKYLRHYAHIQKKLIRKLNRQRSNLSALPASSDSLSHTAYHKKSIPFDSLSVLANNPSLLYNKGSPSKNPTIDSLKKIQSFLQDQSTRLQNTTALSDKAGTFSTDYSEKLAGLQQKFNAQEQVNDLIHQKTSELQSQLNSNDLSGAASLQKDIAIAESKIKYYRQLAADPDAAEEKAYEYLRGTEGFESYLSTDNNAFGGLGNHADIAELQRMGYQTKGMVSHALEQQFRDNLDNIQNKMGSQIARYSEELNAVKSKAEEGKNTYRQGRQEFSTVQNQLKNFKKPDFKNPKRGIPFWHRIKLQYNFQTRKSDGIRPTMLDLDASAAFEQTPDWRWGGAIGTNIGLGSDWQHLRLSYEGISLRAFIDKKIIFDISIEGGYERTFRPQSSAYGQQDLPETAEEDNSILKQTFGFQQQSAYLGLMKSYRINDKWNGTFLIGYDFLGKQNGMQSPIVIRLGWENN